MKNSLKLFVAIAVAAVLTGCNCFSKMAKNQDDVTIACTPDVLALNNGKVEAGKHYIIVITVNETGVGITASIAAWTEVSGSGTMTPDFN